MLNNKYDLTKMSTTSDQQSPPPPPVPIIIESPCRHRRRPFLLLLLAILLFAVSIASLAIGYVLGRWIATHRLHHHQGIFDHQIHSTVSTNAIDEINATVVDDEPTGEQLRLPRTIQPTIYRLDLKLYLPYRDSIDYGNRNFTFAGSLRMEFRCLQTTDRFRLNAKQLLIDESSAQIDRNISIRSIGYFDRFEMIEIQLDNTLTIGEIYIFSVSFSGHIANDTLAGLYRSKYDRTGNGDTR
jgi:hypothetical protein